MDSEQRKIFVGGISWETTKDVFYDYFTTFGEVVASNIVRDRITGNARGFGFVLFSDASVANKALKEKHVILGRTVEVKRAIARGDHNHHLHLSRCNGLNNKSNNNNDQLRTKKIFVGGLPANITEEGFKSYFEKFGNVSNVVVMCDNVTRRPRGFGFISFDSEEAVDNVMQKKFYQMNGKEVEVKRAVPKDENNYGNRNSYSSSYPAFYPPYNPKGVVIYLGFVQLYPYIGGYSYGAHNYGYYGCGGYGMEMSPYNGYKMAGASGSAVSGYMNGGVGAATTTRDHHRMNITIANSEHKQGEEDD